MNMNSHISGWASFSHACCTLDGGREACLSLSSKTNDSMSAGSERIEAR